MEGLKENESFVAVDQFSRNFEYAENWREYEKPPKFGRIVDALTYQPIAGATVEAWSEELNTGAAGFERLSQCITGADGTYWSFPNGKGRVSAEGYYTTTPVDATEGDVIPLFPIDPTQPISQIRFVDTDGRPIPNVRVTSTLTCSHDIYAFDVLSNQNGIAEMPTLGMQDWVPELRFRAAGFMGVEYYQGEDAWYRLPDGSPTTVVLPRMQRPIQARYLNHDGTPAAHRAMYIIDGENYHVLRTDKDGRVNIAYRYEGEEIYTGQFGEAEGSPPYLSFIPREEVTLRYGGDDWEETIAAENRGIVRVINAPDVSDLGDWLSNSRWELVHEDGWNRTVKWDSLLEGVDFPVGKAKLMSDNFNGWLEPIYFELELKAGEVVEWNAAESIQRRRSVQVHKPDGAKSIWIEHDGVTFELRRDEPVFLVEGKPLVARWWVDAGTCFQRFSAAELAETNELFLSDDPKRTVLMPAAAEGESTFAQVRFNGLDPTEQYFASGSVNDDSFFAGDCELRELPDGPLFLLSGREGARYIGEFKLDGYHRARCVGVFPLDPDAAIPMHTLTPIALSSLELVSEQEYTIMGAGEPRWFEKITPGPLHLPIQFEDGRKFELSIQVQAGEERLIDLDDLASSI